MKKFLLLLCSMLVSLTGFAGVVTDKLTADDFPATSTAYTDFTGVKKNSAAVYAGQSAKNDAGAIQMRSKNSNSGIVTTTSGGKVKSVTITVASGTNTIDVYGSNTPYTSATDLYATTGNTSQGTKIGSVSETGTVTFTEEYKYVGIRSNSGAIYLTSVEIEWTTAEEGSVNAPTFTPSEGKFVGSVEVSLKADAGCDIYYTLDGTDPTTTSTKYTAPFTLTETTTVKAIAHNGTKASNVVSKTYTRYIDIANTAETAYTVAQAIEIIDNPLSDLSTLIYVKGTISKIDEIDTEGTFGNATYYIQDEDGTELEVYRGYGLNGQKFNEEGATLIEVGNKVVVYGKVKKFNTTYEFDTASQIVSLTAAPTPDPIVFTDQLTVTVNDVSGTLDASVNLIKHDDGTIDFSLPNFVLAYGEDVMPVGNININGLALVPGEKYDTFNYDGPLTISAGDLEGVDMWMGPMLGELPLKLQGKVNFDDHKLFVNIDIDLSESLAQIINVKFGTDFAEEPEVEYEAAMITADEINALAEGESITLLLATSQKGQFSSSEADTFGWNNSTINITDDELATTNENTAANTDKCRFVFTKTAEGFTIQNKDGKYVGYSGNTIVVGDTPMAWRVVCPQPGGSPNELLVNLDGNNWLNNGIDVKYAVRIVTSEGYWPQCNQAGLSQNLGGWTVLLAWNVTEVVPYVGPAKNQLFTASTPQRGGWMNVDGALKGTLEAGANVATDATDANQLFALVDYKGKTYLWNEGAQHFLNEAGQFVSILAATPIYCTEEAGYEGVCDKTYFFHFSEEKNINLGGSKQILIDDWAEADAGNMMIINATEGFDAEAVAEVIKTDTYKAVTTITWTITDGEGNEIATETQEKCEEGKEYTVKFTLYGVELQGETTVTAGKEDQNITLVAEFTGTLPIEYAASLEEVEHWYALRLHSNQQHWLYSEEGTLAFAGEEAKTDEYAWALVGDPIRGFQLYNKALGAAAALDAANPCTLSEDGLTARFYVYPTAEANHATDGFCLKAYGESQYLNYQGGAIKRWGAADAGSTFVFDEITAPTTYTYTIKLVDTPEDGAYLQIDGNWYSDGETVESESELKPEDVTVSCDSAYTYEVVIENGVITVTFKSATVGISGISGDAKRASIFNLQGQRINAAGRGVSIRNGKKVVK